MKTKIKAISLIFFLFITSSFYLINFSTNQGDLILKEVNSESYSDYHFPKTSAPPLEWQRSVIGWPRVVDMSDDGNYIIAADFENLYLFGKSSSNPIWTFDPGYAQLEYCAISADGNYIAATAVNIFDYDGGVYLFHRSSNVPEWRNNESVFYYEVAISADGNYIAANDYNSKVRLFHRSSKDIIENYTIDNSISDIEMSSDGYYISIGTDGSSGNGVYLFNRTSPDQMWKYSTGSSDVDSVAISSNGDLIVAGHSNYVRLFDKTYSNSKTPLWTYTCDGLVQEVDITPDGKYIAVCTIDGGGTRGEAILLNASTGNALWTYITDVGFTGIAISNDGSYVSACDCGWSGGITSRVYFIHSDGPSRMWKYTIQDGFDIAISQNGAYVVVGTDDDDHSVFLFHGFPPEYPILDSNAKNPDTDGEFNLTWNFDSSVDTYTVYKYDKFISQINNSLEKLDEGIPGTTYLVSVSRSGYQYFVVTAHNQTGFAMSNCISVYVELPPGYFTLDSDTDDPDTDGTFNLTWSKSAGADNYSVYSHDAYIHQIKNNGTLEDQGIEELNYTISGLTSGDYYYMVIAFNETGNTSSNCHQVSVRIPPKPFNMFTDADDPDTDGTFNLTWTQSIGADNYSVYRSNKSISSLDDCIEVKSDITDLNYTVVGMETGTHYFVIVAYNATGFTLSDYVQVKVSIPVYLLPPIPSDDDDDDDDKEDSISFGLYFAPFIAISVLIMIIYKKRKLTYTMQ